ncbi:MAG: IS1595 family transposase [Bacillota bacterium]|nr:IS1595 family transposase [Bacillota bacterium]
MCNHTNNPAEIKEIFEILKALKPSQKKYLEDILISMGIIVPEEKESDTDHVLACPDCSGNSISKFGKNRLGKQRYKCKECRRIFVIPKKSLISCTRKTIRQWLLYMECMAKGMSIRKSAAVVGIHKNTSFHWRHKILNALRGELKNDVSGIVEIDEAFIAESFKGNHSRNPHFHKGRPSRGRGLRWAEKSSAARVRVLCCLDRTENIFSQVIGRERPGIQQLMSILEGKIQSGSTICTNNNIAYKTVAREFDLKLYKLAYSNEAIDEIYHNKKAKEFGRKLKEFITDFNGVATKYLNNYITWLKWDCLGKVNGSGYEVLDMFLTMIFCNACLRVRDLKLVC